MPVDNLGLRGSARSIRRICCVEILNFKRTISSTINIYRDAVLCPPCSDCLNIISAPLLLKTYPTSDSKIEIGIVFARSCR